MSYFARYLDALWSLVAEFWPYFLAGFVVAGLVHEFVSAGTLTRHFGRNSPASLAKATFAGLCTSLCSCGAIPLAVVLRQKGATTANALTFLLASPWAGFTQLFILAGFVGAWRTGVIFAGAMVVSLATGGVLALYEHRHLIEGPLLLPAVDGEGGDGKPNPPIPRRVVRGVLASWEVMREIGHYLLLGILVAAALKAFVPPAWITTYLGPETEYGILLAVPISAVLELCSEGFSVVAGQLFPLGAGLGVVFVMLIVGVTTDFTELLVIYKRFGRRSALAYLVTASICAICMAYAINALVH